MSDIDKNILKALKSLKAKDLTKMKPIDPKIQKIFERVLGPSSKVKKMNMGGVIKGRGGSFKGTR